jgi:hypothetical protein
MRGSTLPLESSIQYAALAAQYPALAAGRICPETASGDCPNDGDRPRECGRLVEQGERQNRLIGRGRSLPETMF